MTHIKIGELSREMGRLKEIEAINAMIATYNHEINNCLAISFGHLKSCLKNNNKESFENLEAALWRIANTVQQIDGITKREEVQYEEYAKNSKVMKLCR
jgi:hypothetical protein